MINPLTRCLEEYSLPPYSQIQSEHIVPAVRNAIREYALDLNSIEDDFSCPEREITWKSVMDRLEIIDDPLLRLSLIIAQLVRVVNSPQLREATAEIQSELHAITSRRKQSAVIYQAINDLRGSVEWCDLTCEQQRILDRAILRAKLDGVGLSDNDKDRYNSINVDLQEAVSISVFKQCYSKMYFNPSDVLGIPPSLLVLLAKNAASAGFPNATTEEGPWMLSLDGPVCLPVLRSALNRTLREELFCANLVKAGEKPFDNKQAIDKILHHRHEQAKLLGFKSFAELSFAMRMAPSVAIVEDMLSELRDKCLTLAKDEHVQLEAYAIANGQSEPIMPWDVPFWAEQMRKQLYQLDDEQIKPYFPLPRVLAGLFEIAHRLFGIQIEGANGEAETWHDEVLFFRIRAMEQAGSPIIAHFYVDPYARPGSKRHNTWIDSIATRSVILRNESSSVRLPVFSLAFNLTPPAGDIPSLMTFNEVQHLFINFGYGLRKALTAANYSWSSGFSGQEWDVVEIPSQFMESMAYCRDTLPLISSHYKTGLSLPAYEFDKLLAAKKFRLGTYLLRQLYFCALDFELHHRYDASEPIFDVQRRIALNYSVIPPHNDDKHLCSFTHLFSGGYGAGYYSYLWSEILSADAFACFEESRSTEEWQAHGRRFRDTVLA